MPGCAHGRIDNAVTSLWVLSLTVQPMADTTPSEPVLPTVDDEERLWALIEQAWSGAGESVNAARHALATRPPVPRTAETDTDQTEDPLGRQLMATVDAAGDAFIQQLRDLAAELSSPELTALDRVVERRLYDLDREEVHDVTDGSDDGFLYARGFILAVGRDFYAAVDADPRLAVLDADLEAMCYLFAHVHEQKFGAWPESGSGISRETCQNPTGWPTH